MKRLVLAAPLAALPLAAGCVKHVSANGGTVYTYELWVPLVVLLGCLLTIPIGLVLAMKRGWRGALFPIAGLVVAFLLVPGLFTSSVRVDADRVEIHEGLWIAPTEATIVFAETKEIVVIHEKRRGRRGKTNHKYYFDVTDRSGAHYRVSNEALTKAARDEIHEKANARGVLWREVEPS